jgi:hypothetical protein
MDCYNQYKINYQVKSYQGEPDWYKSIACGQFLYQAMEL